MKHRYISALAMLAGLPALMVAGTGAVLAVDWDAVEGREIPLFYPGQTGFEWILDKRAHDGAARFEKRSKPCRECHEGEELDYGMRMSRGEAWESAPLSGRRGAVNVSMKAATEAGKLYIRLEWPNIDAAAGRQLDPDFQSKVTLMLGDDSVPLFVQGGCWVVCHQDARKMPEASGEGLPKYLPDSRNDIVKRVGGGEDYKSDDELTELMGAGVFLEFWQARLNPGAEPEVLSGHILKERTEHENTTLTADASLENGNWVVEFSRPLEAGGDGVITISQDQTFTFGIGLHDQYTSGRYHVVSFEYTMGFGGGTDLDIEQF